MSTIATDYATYAASTATPVMREVKKELDRDAFMKLLTTQLQYQDPLKPMEDREFIAQLAQFSSLEQMQQTNQYMQAMVSSMLGTNAAGLVGHTVTAQTPEDAAAFTGRVDAVTFIDGMPQLVIGDRTVSPIYITRIE
jgi:flagellar basal-body rod modification protein FlgD